MDAEGGLSTTTPANASKKRKPPNEESVDQTSKQKLQRGRQKYFTVWSVAQSLGLAPPQAEATKIGLEVSRGAAAGSLAGKVKERGIYVNAYHAPAREHIQKALEKWRNEFYVTPSRPVGNGTTEDKECTVLDPLTPEQRALLQQRENACNQICEQRDAVMAPLLVEFSNAKLQKDEATESEASKKIAKCFHVAQLHVDKVMQETAFESGERLRRLAAPLVVSRQHPAVNIASHIEIQQDERTLRFKPGTKPQVKGTVIHSQIEDILKRSMPDPDEEYSADDIARRIRNLEPPTILDDDGTTVLFNPDGFAKLWEGMPCHTYCWQGLVEHPVRIRLEFGDGESLALTGRLDVTTVEELEVTQKGVALKARDWKNSEKPLLKLQQIHGAQIDGYLQGAAVQLKVPHESVSGQLVSIRPTAKQPLGCVEGDIVPALPHAEFKSKTFRTLERKRRLIQGRQGAVSGLALAMPLSLALSGDQAQRKAYQKQRRAQPLVRAQRKAYQKQRYAQPLVRAQCKAYQKQRYAQPLVRAQRKAFDKQRYAYQKQRYAAARASADASAAAASASAAPRLR